MKITTPVEKLHFEKKLEPGQRILTIGSCFSEVMGEKLKTLPLEIMNQPLGTLFHPNAISNVLNYDPIQEKVCYQVDGQFVHPHFHSKWKDLSYSALLHKINSEKQKVYTYLSRTNWLIITFGTSFYYYDKEFNLPVANCHKQNQKRFIKKLSSIEDITNNWTQFLDKLHELNPNLSILLTVSPVRHTKDGIQNNQLSKSTLRLAVDYLIKKYTFVYYFPAYEYLLDELRDYSYYKNDLIHPNEIAEDFIFMKLKEAMWVK
jgi:hypothetical protein